MSGSLKLQFAQRSRKQPWEVYAPLAPSLSLVEVARIVDDTRRRLLQAYNTLKQQKMSYDAAGAAAMVSGPSQKAIDDATVAAVTSAEAAAKGGRRPYIDMPAAVQPTSWGTEISWKSGREVKPPEPSAISTMAASEASKLIDQGFPWPVAVSSAARVVQTARQVAATPLPEPLPWPEDQVPAPSPYAVADPNAPADSAWGEGETQSSAEPPAPIDWGSEYGVTVAPPSDETWAELSGMGALKIRRKFKKAKRAKLHGLGEFAATLPWWVFAGAGALFLWWLKHRRKKSRGS